jgi:hypothetical protein
MTGARPGLRRHGTISSLEATHQWTYVGMGETVERVTDQPKGQTTLTSSQCATQP